MSATLPLTFPLGFAATPIKIKRFQFTTAEWSAIVLAAPYTLISGAAGSIIAVTAIAIRVTRDGIAWSGDSNIIVKYENEGAGTPILNQGSFGLNTVNAAGYSRLVRPLLPALQLNRVPATSIAGQLVHFYQNIAPNPNASVTTFTLKISYYIL